MNPAPKKNTLLTISDLTAALTVLSLVPYEIESLGVLVPPNVKAWAIGIGAFSTLVLRLMARFLEAKK